MLLRSSSSQHQGLDRARLRWLQGRIGLHVSVAHKKSNLPTKICLTCGRAFAWRKKWERDWDQVRYCSDRCRGLKTSGTPPTPPS